MDKLSAKVAEARKLGMTYGQYMVYLSKNEQSDQKQEPTQAPATEKPRPVCKICGKEIPPYSGRRCYCSKECHETFIRNDARERNRKAKGISPDEIITCPACGKQFQRGNRHANIKYCSPECSLKRHRVTRKKKGETMKVMLERGAKLPSRAHRYDGGLDLYCKDDVEEIVIPPYGGSVTIDTGCHVQIPQHFVGLVKSKSGMMVNHQILTDGTVDANYTGSIHVTLFNNGQFSYTVKPGQKIAQLVIVPCCLPPLELVDELESTSRGNSGFGSTGMF